MALFILTLNANGLCDSSKREGLEQWLRSFSVNVDVVCLQESHSVSDTECYSWFSYSGFCVFSSGLISRIRDHPKVSRYLTVIFPVV